MGIQDVVATGSMTICKTFLILSNILLKEIRQSSVQRSSAERTKKTNQCYTFITAWNFFQSLISINSYHIVVLQEKHKL